MGLNKPLPTAFKAIVWACPGRSSTVRKEDVDPAEIEYLADRAVTELIEDAKSGRLNMNQDLAEIIKACIRKTSSKQLETLKVF